MAVTSEIELRAVQSSEELRLANDLMAKVHDSEYYNAFHWLETHGAGYPGFHREHTRIALIQNELAGALRLTTDTIRIGEARLKMGGFGWVTTAAQHRHKGVARKLMRDTLQYMLHNQYHVSMLFGIPNFYHHFGYTTTLAEYSTTVPTLEATKAQHAPYRVREAKPGDIAAIQKMHNQHDGGVSCSLVRNRGHIMNRWENWQPVQVLTDENGKAIAYFLPRSTPEGLHVAEIGVQEWRACGALLHACGQAALEQCTPRITFAAPPCHPFLQYLLRYQSSHEMKIQRDEGGMMAFVNLEETLETMIAEWENTLLKTAAQDYRTEVTLVVARRPFRIRANRGAIDVAQASGQNKISLSEHELMHLLTGYRYLDEILATQRRILTAEGKALLSALFPKRHAYVWKQDRF